MLHTDSRTTIAMSQSSHTVLIVGAGPTGLFLALRLLQAGIKVTVVEAKPKLDNSTKALVHIPTVYPEYKRAGVLEDVLAAAGSLKSTGLLFRKTSDKSIIAQMPNVPGRPGPCVVPQSKFASILLEKVQQYNGQHVLFGEIFKSFQEREGGGVSVVVENADGQQKTIEAEFLIAADGGKSALRKAADIPFEGETLPYQLVATDLRYPFEQYGWDPLLPNFLADPDHYGLVTPIDGNGLWRCSYGMPLDRGDASTTTSRVPGYSMTDIQATLPSKIEHMLPSAAGEKPRDWELVNVAPYKAQQLCAQNFRKGSIILIGDAAHLTNPFAGMGLNAGIFDAASLADVLECILQRGGAATSLIDAWAVSRKGVFTKIVDPMSRAAFVACRDPDVDSLPQRHPMLKAMKVPGAKPPDLRTDTSTLEGWVS